MYRSGLLRSFSQPVSFPPEPVLVAVVEMRAVTMPDDAGCCERDGDLLEEAARDFHIRGFV